MTRLVARLRRSFKALPKPKPHQKEIMVTVSGLLLMWSMTDLNPSEATVSEKYAQQIDEIQWKLQCLQSAFINRKGPILFHNTQLHITQPIFQKLNESGYEVLPHLPYSPDLSPTDYPFLKHLDNLLQAKCFHNQQEVENASQEFVESQSTYFHTIGINKLISHWQKHVDCNGFYFD